MNITELGPFSGLDAAIIREERRFGAVTRAPLSERNACRLGRKNEHFLDCEAL